MADNFLEKQYEEWKNGRPSVHRKNPSLEALVKRLGEQSPRDESYMVKQAQLDAIVRTASALGLASEFITDEDSASITVKCSGPVMLGETLLAIRLKAVELKLQSEVKISSDTSAAIIISKAL